MRNLSLSAHPSTDRAVRPNTLSALSRTSASRGRHSHEPAEPRLIFPVLHNVDIKLQRQASFRGCADGSPTSVCAPGRTSSYDSLHGETSRDVQLSGSGQARMNESTLTRASDRLVGFFLLTPPAEPRLCSPMLHNSKYNHDWQASSKEVARMGLALRCVLPGGPLSTTKSTAKSRCPLPRKTVKDRCERSYDFSERSLHED